MGFNTVIVVLNDHLDEIEKDQEFGKKVASAIRAFSRSRPERMPYVTGQTQVISVCHADDMQIVAVGGNTGRVLGYGGYAQSDEALVKGLTASIRRRAKEKAQGAKDAASSG